MLRARKKRRKRNRLSSSLTFDTCVAYTYAERPFVYPPLLFERPHHRLSQTTWSTRVSLFFSFHSSSFTWLCPLSFSSLQYLACLAFFSTSPFLILPRAAIPHSSSGVFTILSGILFRLSSFENTHTLTPQHTCVQIYFILKRAYHQTRQLFYR